jgi:hypothetical protein
MVEFIFSRAEMLALMLAVKTSLIPGLDNDRLIPAGQAEQKALTLQGLEILKQCGLLRVEGDTTVLNGDVGLMATALAYPQVITIITRDTPGVGQQQFLHYRYDPVHVELTMPTIEQYRLAALPDAATALARLRQILPVNFEHDSAGIKQKLNQEIFYQIKSLAEGGQQVEATTIVKQEGFSSEEASQLLQTLRHPTLGGTITYLRVRDQQIVDARDLAMVQDTQTAWLIRQVVPGEPILNLETVTAVQYSTALLDTLNSLWQ